LRSWYGQIETKSRDTSEQNYAKPAVRTRRQTRDSDFDLAIRHCRLGSNLSPRQRSVESDWTAMDGGDGRDITALGSYAVLIIITGAVVLYLLFAQRRAAALWISLALLGGVLLSNLLKLAYERPRPDLCLMRRACSPRASPADMQHFRRSPI